ncbi:hypothetical protein Tco_1402336 [Tanacetum coccineum]
MFVQGVNANFGTMANAVAHSMTDEKMRQKVASEKLKDCLYELVKLKISTGDVLHAGSKSFVLESGTSSSDLIWAKLDIFGESCSSNDQIVSLNIRMSVALFSLEARLRRDSYSLVSAKPWVDSVKEHVMYQKRHEVNS